MGPIVLVTLTLFLFIILAQSADYFDYKKKFRPCGVLKFRSSTLTAVESEETIPPGFTFFSSAPLTSISYEIKEIKEKCRAKHCEDGPYQQNCQTINIGDIIEFENSAIETLICTCQSDVPEIFQDKDFDRNLTGAVFSPYVKNWIKSVGRSTVSKWNNYTIEEVKTLIALMATKFSHFSTYGIGATSASRSWQGGDSTGLVPVATAEVNKILKSKGLPVLRLTQGIYQNEYSDIQNQEIRNAFAAAQDANTIFPGTVSGLILTSDFVTNNATGSEVYQILDENRGRAKELDLKVGIRLRSCTDIIPTRLSEADNNLHSVPSNYTYNDVITNDVEVMFKNLIQRVDFIICSNPPPAFLVDEAMTDVVYQYGAIFLKIQTILRAVNPNLKVIAQGGWASWGVSRNGAMNNLTNMVEFWNRMNAWAIEHNFLVDLFEAFDEPWKTDVNDRSSASGGPSGPSGAEGNYGWWKRHDSPSGNLFTYVPKVEELESLDPEGEAFGWKTSGPDSVTLALVTVIVAVVAVTGILVWRLRRAKTKTVAKNVRDIVEEFRNGAASSSGVPTTHLEKENGKAGDAVALESMEQSKEKSFIFALRFPYDKKYELAKKNFSIDEGCILGQGNYGIVYKGKIEGVGEVAFKTLNSNGSIIELKNLLSEIKIMAYVGKHEHIVNLLGAYTAKIEQGLIYVASEYCALGSLEKYLKAQRPNFQDGSHKSSASTPALPPLNYVIAFIQSDPTPSPFIIPQKPLTVTDLLKWSYQIAFGMEHIAKKKVIHSDLAARNILLTVDGTAKIADFGLSRQLYYQSDYLKSNSNEELPWRWMSVESLRSLVFSIESDVWTFGITLWEVFSLAELPYPGVPGWTPSFLHELEINNYRMEAPRHAPEEIFQLMADCWLRDPAMRPSFSGLKEKLYKKWQQQLQLSCEQPNIIS